MHLSNILLSKKINFFIFLLVFAYLLLGLLFLGKYKAEGVFFSTDPDVVYVANALSYIRSNQIGYIDHPGTPAITLLSYSYIPIRVYTKLFTNIGFITWSMINFRFLFLYSRLVSLFISIFAMSMFLYAVYKLTKSRMTIMFSFLSLFLLSPFYYLQVGISAEPTSFLITSFWLLTLAYLVFSGNKAVLIILGLISGISFGNRATAAFLILATFLTSLIYIHGTISRIIKDMLMISFASLTGFILALWPIHRRLWQVVASLLSFAGHTQVHGGGSQSVFDFNLYVSSIKSLSIQEQLPAIFIFLGLILLVLSFTKKKNKTDIVIFSIAASAMLGLLVFSKFPLSHYQLTNYVVIVFAVSYFVNKMPQIVKISLITVLIFGFIKTSDTFYRTFSSEVNKVVILNRYSNIHKAKIATVWDWSRSEEFSLIWARNWGGGLFNDEIKVYRPQLLELKPDFVNIGLSYSEEQKIFDVCWDQMYIQQEDLPVFMVKNQNSPKLQFNQVVGTNMIEIRSDHCQGTTKP